MDQSSDPIPEDVPWFAVDAKLNRANLVKVSPSESQQAMCIIYIYIIACVCAYMTRTIPYSQQDFGYQKKNHWEQWRHGDITYKKPHDLRHHKIKLQVGVLLRHRYR